MRMRSRVVGMLLLTVLVGSSPSGQSGSPIELISVTPGGIAGGGQEYVDEATYDRGGPSHVSADNRFVVFVSASSQLVAGDVNNYADIFLRDRQTGITSIVSLASDGSQANGHSGTPVISADGRYVAFVSLASNLAPLGSYNGSFAVFVRDLQANTTTLVSVSTGGAVANYGAIDPAISADGRYVVFASASDTLVPGDTNVFNYDIFVRDTFLNTTERVSLRPDGTEIVGSDSASPSISADGRRIAFVVWSNTTAGPTPSVPSNLHHGVYVRDRRATTRRRSSVPGRTARLPTCSFRSLLSSARTAATCPSPTGKIWIRHFPTPTWSSTAPIRMCLCAICRRTRRDAPACRSPAVRRKSRAAMRRSAPTAVTSPTCLATAASACATRSPARPRT